MNGKVLLKRMASSGLAQGGLGFFVATGAVSVSNFLFHVVISRLLGPSVYGALGALLNVLLILSVPLGAIQAAVTRSESAHLHSEGHGIGLRSAMMRAGLTGVIGTVNYVPRYSSTLVFRFMTYRLLSVGMSNKSKS